MVRTGTAGVTGRVDTEIVAYLTYLADERHVSRSTQMQALSALLLLVPRGTGGAGRRPASCAPIVIADAFAVGAES